MKLTKSQLKKIIKEEITEALKVLSENDCKEQLKLGLKLRKLRDNPDYRTADFDEFLRIIKIYDDKGNLQTEDELYDAYMLAAPPVK